MASSSRGYSPTWPETSERGNLESIFKKRYKSGTPISSRMPCDHKTQYCGDEASTDQIRPELIENLRVERVLAHLSPRVVRVVP